VAGAAVAPPGGMPPGFGNMEEMMNNPMVKEMMNNPDMMKQAMDMMNGGQGAAGGQPPDMQNLMKNPSMSNLMSNPAMLSQAVGMLKSNPAMMEMMQKQMPGVDQATMVKGLEWLASLAGYYAKTRNFLNNKFVQLCLILVVISIVFYFFGR